MPRTVTLVRHHVADFDAWKKEYDSATPLQQANGVRAQQVLRSAQDPNDVIVSHTFDSSEAAHDFMAKPEIRDAMKRAGVNADSLKTTYYNEVETEKIAVS
jgi:heme-degrading monooxygenase HmoA